MIRKLAIGIVALEHSSGAWALGTPGTTRAQRPLLPI